MPHDILYCHLHQRPLECLGGHSAHLDNWFCPECDEKEIATSPPESLKALPFRIILPKITLEMVEDFYPSLIERTREGYNWNQTAVDFAILLKNHRTSHHSSTWEAVDETHSRCKICGRVEGP